MSAWTKERPTEPDYYWVRCTPLDPPDLVRVAVPQHVPHGVGPRRLRADWCDGGSSWAWASELDVEWQRAEPKP